MPCGGRILDRHTLVGMIKNSESRDKRILAMLAEAQASLGLQTYP